MPNRFSYGLLGRVESFDALKMRSSKVISRGPLAPTNLYLALRHLFVDRMLANLNTRSSVQAGFLEVFPHATKQKR